MATGSRKKKFPFRRGQRVRLKDTGKICTIESNGPATIGDPHTCKIPGGPLVLKDYVYVRVMIKGKRYFCIEKIDNLEKV